MTFCLPCSPEGADDLIYAVQGPPHFLMLSVMLLQIEVQCAMAVPVLMKEEGNRSLALALRGNLLGLWPSGFILLPLWLAWDLLVMRGYGFDSKIYSR